MRQYLRPVNMQAALQGDECWRVCAGVEAATEEHITVGPVWPHAAQPSSCGHCAHLRIEALPRCVRLLHALVGHQHAAVELEAAAEG